MLLSQLLSLKIQLGQDTDSVGFDNISLALQKLPTVTLSAEELHDNNSLHRRQAKSTSQLIYSLESREYPTLVEISLALGHPDPFDHFDERTWALLHQACFENYETRTAIYSRVYTWLSQHLASTQAMQARLFLMSQPLFKLTEAGYDIIAEPIINSDNNWALLALLSCPQFDIDSITREHQRQMIAARMLAIVKTQKNNPYNGIKENIKSDLWAFVRYSGIGSTEKKSLLMNIIKLNIEPSCGDLPASDLSAFIKISRSIENMTSDIKEFLEKIIVRLVAAWDLEPTITPEETKASDTTIEAETLDIQKNNAIVISQQCIDIIIIPEMLDIILANEANAAKIAKKLNETFGIHFDFFSTSVFSLLWKGQRRICLNTSVDWLLSLKTFQELRFISDVNCEMHVAKILQSGDIYFLEKLLEIHAKLKSRSLNLSKAMTPDLFKAMTQLPAYEDETTKTAIKILLQNPMFEINSYWESASPAFQELPACITAQYLSLVFYSTNINCTVLEPSITLETDTLLHEINHRYKEFLREMVASNNSAADETFIAMTDAKIIKIFKLIKQIPEEKQKEFYRNNNFIDFLLSYRILAMQKESGKEIIKGAKMEKIKFLEIVRAILISEFRDEKLSITQVSYIACKQLEIKAQFDALYSATTTEDRDARKQALSLLELAKHNPCQKKVNTWLTDNIITQYLSNSASKIEQTLHLLPDGIFDAIFTGSNIPLKNNTPLEHGGIASSTSSMYGSGSNQRKFSLSSLLLGQKNNIQL